MFWSVMALSVGAPPRNAIPVASQKAAWRFRHFSQQGTARLFVRLVAGPWSRKLGSGNCRIAIWGAQMLATGRRSRAAEGIFMDDKSVTGVAKGGVRVGFLDSKTRLAAAELSGNLSQLQRPAFAIRQLSWNAPVSTEAGPAR
jgi:hypothetical protein